MITALVAVALLVVTAGFLAAAETALTNVPRVRAIALVEAEERGAEREVHDAGDLALARLLDAHLARHHVCVR